MNHEDFKNNIDKNESISEDVILRKNKVEVNLSEATIKKLLDYEAECEEKLKMAFWYAVQCIGGREHKILKELKQKIVDFENEDFHRIFVCFKLKTSKTKKGRTLRRIVNDHSGYFYIKMNLTKEARRIVRETQYIIAFLGEIRGEKDTQPLRLSEMEVEKDIAKYISKPKMPTKEIKVTFKVGDYVEVTHGVFEGEKARVISISKESVLVAINILGRDVETEIPLQSVKET